MVEGLPMQLLGLGQGAVDVEISAAARWISSAPSAGPRASPSACIIDASLP